MFGGAIHREGLQPEAAALGAWLPAAGGVRTIHIAANRSGGSGMSGAHSAPWGGKSRARHGAAQVVIGITVAAGKVWAAKPENVLDLGGRGALRKELPGDPKIEDAPVRLRKPLCIVPPLHLAWVALVRPRSVPS